MGCVVVIKDVVWSSICGAVIPNCPKELFRSGRVAFCRLGNWVVIGKKQKKMYFVNKTNANINQ